MVLVRERGRAMAGAAGRTPTGMTAILGGERDEVLSGLERHGLTAANDNGPGQIVAAGTREQLAALAEDPPARTRLTPLPVAGAFHTAHMASATDRLRELAPAVSTHDARTPVISNRDGAVVHSGPDVLTRIVDQVSSPVRWDLCLQAMADLGVTGLLELPPAGTLTAIAKRALPGVETFALRTPDQLDDARAFCERHGTPSPLDESPTWRLVVAPAKGTFMPAPDLPAGASVPARTSVGSVLTRRDETPVTAPHGGTLVEWLVHEGDPVSPGQPLVRLHPAGAAS
jgi:[acyl-carrier-protein] S-malonyltransferase